MHSKQHGFTLIELMVAMAVAGILAATAYPSFAGPLFKARRTDGITALLQPRDAPPAGGRREADPLCKFRG